MQARHRSLKAYFATCLTLLLSAASPGFAQQHCKYGAPYQGPETLEPLSHNTVYAGKIDIDNVAKKELSDLLQREFTKVFALTGASAGAISLYSEQHGYWQSDIDSLNQQKGGLAEHSKAPQKRFWLASIGKLATAVIIGQLMEEKQLLLDDTISRWLPEVPNAELITIAQLLNHTAGVFNLSQDKKLNKQTGFKGVSTLIDLASKQAADFCPGTYWNYSNTGYMILGHIAELLDEKPLAKIVQERISTPLGLNSFRTVRRTDQPTSLVLPIKDNSGYVDDVASVHGAGSIAANMNDSLLFLAAYLRGDLISSTSVADSLRTLYPLYSDAIGYGQGIMVTRVPDESAPSIWIGHAGGAPQAKALLIYDVERKTYLSVALNTQGAAEAIANHLLKAIDSYEQSPSPFDDQPTKLAENPTKATALP